MSSNPQQLNDVALTSPPNEMALTLDEVGLESVQTLVQVDGHRLPAQARAWVSLKDIASRGIHMSRLYKIITGLCEKELTWAHLTNSLESILQTHSHLSDAGLLSVEFELPILRRALVSEEEGWRTYPMACEVKNIDGKWHYRLSLRVLYSSTCPCSAALSRQALRDRFAEIFKETSLSRERVLAWLDQPEALVASAHAQRSEARCDLTFSDPDRALHPRFYLDLIEKALGTPVQAAVKRSDEQEFARLNANNLMFCEDAARRLKGALLKSEEVTDFAIEVRHFESLHPHDVVAKVRKNN